VRILVVDDEPSLWELLEVLLVREGHGVTVAASVEADKEPARIFTIRTSGAMTRQPLTGLDSDSRYPAWTRDSKRIAFQNIQHRGIWWMAADRTDRPTRLTFAAAGEEHIPESWAVDGTLIYSITTNGIARLWTLPVRHGRATTPSSGAGAIDPAAGKPVPFGNETSRDPMSATFSPDGKHVAYTRTDSLGVTVCVEAFPSQGSQCMEPYLADSPKHPRWSPDGKRIYYDPRPGDFESVEVSFEPEVKFGERRPVPYHPFLLAPPGFRTPYDVNKYGHFVGLIPADRDEYQPKPARSVVIVWNWYETVKQKIGWTWFDTLKSIFW